MSKKWADDYSSDEESVDANDKDLVSDDEELVALPVQQLLKRPVENNTNNNATPSTDDISFIAHVSGINFSVDRKTLGTFFETAGCLLLNVEMIEKGTALIKFGNKESLDICLKMDNTSLQGRNFRTTVFSAQEPPRKPRSDGGHRGRGFSDGKDKGGFRGGSGGRDGGRGRGRGFGDADRNRGPPAAANAKRVQSSSEAQAEAPLTRPKLNLQPRSLPVDAIGVPVVKTLIFGDGRPQDEQAYEEQRRKEKLLSTKPVSSECLESSAVESNPNVFQFVQTEAALPESGRVETGSADQLVDSEKPAVPEAVGSVSADASVDKRKKGSPRALAAGGPGQKGFQSRNSTSNRFDRSGGDQRPGTAGGRGGGRGGKVTAAASGEELQPQVKAAASSFRGGPSHDKGSKPAASKFAPNKKLFEDAVHQTAGLAADGRKDRQKGALSAAASELTNEEKFNRAQQSFQAKGTVAVQGASAAVKRSTKSGGFAALQSDEESDA